MSFLPALGAIAQGVGAALQAPPATATRASADYAPYTTVNAPGQVDLSQIASLIHSINSDNAYVGGLAGKLSPTSLPIAATESLANMAMIGGLLLMGYLLWRKFKT